MEADQRSKAKLSRTVIPREEPLWLLRLLMERSFITLIDCPAVDMNTPRLLFFFSGIIDIIKVTPHYSPPGTLHRCDCDCDCERSS